MWFGIFLVVCVAFMVDDAIRDCEFIENIKNLEE